IAPKRREPPTPFPVSSCVAQPSCGSRFARFASPGWTPSSASASPDPVPMARNPGCAVYIGNLDEKVSERVLYEILIQVGRVVDLHIPRDKETSRPKGFAFAEYETEEIAQYAVRLFSGLVRLHNRTLKFAISGQDKASSNVNVPVTPKMNPIPLSNPPQPMRFGDTPVSQHRVVNGRIAGHGVSPNHSYDFHSQGERSFFCHMKYMRYLM
uniref:RRM domain-containing protein n=2 Tax=Aegilops tauschii subsp. strangulata TaxID=200361 RepID=A0A452Z6A7_AEGTS